MAEPFTQDLYVPPEGLNITLSASGLIATLPSGRKIPLPAGPSAFDQVYHLLHMQARTSRQAARDAKLGEATDPTLHYLRHYSEHVLKDARGEGCPFCREHWIAPSKVEARGEIVKLDRARAKREAITMEHDPEPLGL